GGFHRAPATLLPAPVTMSSLFAYFVEAERKRSPVHAAARGRHFSSARRKRSESGWVFMRSRRASGPRGPFLFGSCELAALLVCFPPFKDKAQSGPKIPPCGEASLN